MAEVEPLTLIGRDRELRTLRDTSALAAAGSGQSVLIAGDAGLGKTALVRGLEKSAVAEGFVTAWGHCWESLDTPAFWAWSQVLRVLHPGDDWSDVAPWVAAELEPLVASEIDEQRSRDGNGDGRRRFVLFRAVGAYLRQVSQQRPLMVVIEDLHAADEATLLLLRSLIEEYRSDRILVIGTFDPKLARRRPTQAELLGDIGRMGERIALDPLTRSEVAALFERVSETPVSDEILDTVFEVTEGNPFFVEETARLLSSKGTLNRPDYSRGFLVPEGARGLVRARLMCLPQPVQELLTAAAALGREFEVDVLADVTGIVGDTVFELLHEPVAVGVIEETGTATYRFTHTLLREAAYEELKAANRMRLHRRIAEALEERYGDDLENHYQELAHHWFKAAQGGDLAKTIRFAEAAAEQALAQHAYEEAERLYLRALKASESLRSSREVRERLKDHAEHAREQASAESAVDTPPAATEASFRRDGDLWRISFGGSEALLRDSKGLGYLSRLLARPGAEVHCLELAGAAGAGRATPPVASEELTSDALGDLGPLLDEAAKKAYRARLTELEDEIDEAGSFNDPEREARAAAERAALVQQLAGAVGLGGRDRKAGAASERARISVTKNIKEALKRISEAVPPLGDHLHATLRTGTYCCYTPDPRVPIQWRT